jgi:hypothetical protein
VVLVRPNFRVFQEGIVGAGVLQKHQATSTKRHPGKVGKATSFPEKIVINHQNMGDLLLLD